MKQIEINDAVRQPWVGDNYDNRRLGKRLLLIGESHYGNNGDTSDLTRNVVQLVCNGERISFFTKIAGLFDYKPREFYANVAFYNFVQKIYDGPRRPVAYQERRDPLNQKLFIDILEKLKPERVLVLGKTNWQFLPSAYSDNSKLDLCQESKLELILPGKLHASEQSAYWYRTGISTWALVGSISHPSAFGFHPEQSRKWVKKFMKFAGGPS